MKNQKEPRNQTIVEELEKGPEGPWTHIDFMSTWKLKMVLENEKSLRELEGRAWRAPEPNVMYSVHCTVQYHAGAIDEDSAVGFPAVTTEVNAGNNKMEDQLTDTGTDKNLMADVLKTKVYDRNCMGTHLTPHLRHYSNMLDKSQTEDDAYEVEGDDVDDFDFNLGPRRHLQVADPSRRSAEQGSEPAADPASSQLSSAVSRLLGSGTVHSSEGKARTFRTLSKNPLVICRNPKSRGKVKSNLTFPNYNLRLKSQG